MSLILEALKKSEQQRRLGEAPTLGSPVLAVRSGRSLLPLFAILIAIAIGTAWWLLRPASTAAPSTVPTPAGAGNVGDAEAPPMNRIKPIASRPAPTRPAQAKSESAKLTPGGLGAIAPPLPIAPPMNDRPGSVTQLPLPPAAAGVAPAATRIATPSPAPAAPRPATPAASAASAPVAAVAAHPAPAAANSAARLPLVWDLPYATRKDLPDLTLTMHVYAPDPHERFVVIKGERHVEGDDLGSGVILHEISPDGMVLDFKGTRFMYPRGGG